MFELLIVCWLNFSIVVWYEHHESARSVQELLSKRKKKGKCKHTSSFLGLLGFVTGQPFDVSDQTLHTRDFSLATKTGEQDLPEQKKELLCVWWWCSEQPRVSLQNGDLPS